MIKVREKEEVIKCPSKFNFKIPPLKHERTEVIKIGFHQ